MLHWPVELFPQSSSFLRRIKPKNRQATFFIFPLDSGMVWWAPCSKPNKVNEKITGGEVSATVFPPAGLLLWANKFKMAKYRFVIMWFGLK